MHVIYFFNHLYYVITRRSLSFDTLSSIMPISVSFQSCYIFFIRFKNESNINFITVFINFKTLLQVYVTITIKLGEIFQYLFVSNCFCSFLLLFFGLRVATQTHILQKLMFHKTLKITKKFYCCFALLYNNTFQGVLGLRLCQIKLWLL